MEPTGIERTKQMVQRMMELGEMIQPGSMKEFNDRNPNFFTDEFYQVLHESLMQMPIEPDFDPDAKSIDDKPVFRPRSKSEMQQLVDIYGDEAVITPYIDDALIALTQLDEDSGEVVFIIRVDFEIHINTKSRAVQAYLRKECPNENILKKYCSTTKSTYKYIDTVDVWKIYEIESDHDLLNPTIAFSKLYFTPEQQKELQDELSTWLKENNEQ